MAETKERTVEISLARLHQLHEDVLRYWFVRTMARGTSLHMDGTQQWSLAPGALPYRAATFDEAVDQARAHHCACCQEDQAEDEG
jgi:hypothetical protein